jgi:benzoyl-CoA 2,3-dioxygenase component B
LLQRRSGHPDTPRMLGAFNEKTPDWLSFFMFTYFTDRDGKMQLEALAQSGFDPLSRTCRFMLTEEAHHMFVGETGVSRIVQRTCEAMKEAGISDPYDIAAVRKLGVIDLPTIQKKANLHFSLTLDLFGNEISTNAANAYHAGLKGRYREDRIKDDHQLERDTYPVLRLVDGKIQNQDAAALSALNMRLRDDYVTDANIGVTRWNKVIADAGIPFAIALPHVAFHRHIGEFAKINADVNGNMLSDAEWAARRNEFLPSDGDKEFIESLMQPQMEPGKYAGWIAPPRLGIDNKPGDFEYVKIADA